MNLIGNFVITLMFLQWLAKVLYGNAVKKGKWFQDGSGNSELNISTQQF